MKIALALVSSVFCLTANAGSGYFAPFSGGTTASVSQDSLGASSHFGSGGPYAVDFAGIFDVHASKGGVVEVVGQDAGRPQYCITNPQYWNGSANYIRIRHSDGLYSYYYHLSSMSVAVNQTVVAGQKIGVSGNTGCSTSNHLHFQLSRAQNQLRANSVDVVFDDIGRPVSGGSYTSGNWLRVPQSTFDGAGSLVDPSYTVNGVAGNGCLQKAGIGCNRDIVQLHANALPSTGVFQVLKAPGFCESVKIEGLQEAYVAIKTWDEGYPGSNLNGSSTLYHAKFFPAQIPLSTGATPWNLISVTTVIPIPSGGRTITMTCQPHSVTASTNVEIAPPMQNRSSDVTTVIPQMSDGYYWGGNGSLITYSSNQGYTDTVAGYGRTRDVGKKLTTLASKTVFQVYSDVGSCRNVRFSRRDGKSTAVTLRWKLWNQPTWVGMNVGLPYTLRMDNFGYSIVTVDNAVDGFGATYIDAECI